MRQLQLISPNIKYIKSYINFIEECHDDIIKNGFEYCIPLSTKITFQSDIHKLICMSKNENLPPNWVPYSVFWLVDHLQNMIGVIAIRHTLTQKLMFRGGHISYYIRPSQRNKGYASQMLSMALKHCKQLNISQVLITCSKDNIGSIKVIQANGGILESEEQDSCEKFQRYFINT